MTVSENSLSSKLVDSFQSVLLGGNGRVSLVLGEIFTESEIMQLARAAHKLVGDVGLGNQMSYLYPKGETPVTCINFSAGPKAVLVGTTLFQSIRRMQKKGPASVLAHRLDLM